MMASLLASRFSSLAVKGSLWNLHQTRLPVLASKSQAIRSFGKKKRNKKKENEAKRASRSPPVGDKPSLEDEASLQHKEWVKFQQSISVEGFETGQTVEVQSTKKAKGGKANRKKTKRDLLEEKLKEKQRFTDVSGGEFPPMRYSDEETERLLKQAYAALPKRDGKRGTRNLKRQKRRWVLVREIRRKYKAHLANFQVRKMKERSRKIKEVKAILAEAPSIREKDRDYQLSIYREWAQRMAQGQGESTDTTTEGMPQKVEM